MPRYLSFDLTIISTHKACLLLKKSRQRNADVPVILRTDEHHGRRGWTGLNLFRCAKGQGMMWRYPKEVEFQHCQFLRGALSCTVNTREVKWCTRLVRMILELLYVIPEISSQFGNLTDTNFRSFARVLKAPKLSLPRAAPAGFEKERR